MLDREGLLDLAEIIQLKGEVKAKQGDETAFAFFEVSEGLRALAADPALPAITLTVPHAGPYRDLAILAVMLVSKRISPEEYVEAAQALGISRSAASERAASIAHLKATATA